MLDKLDRSCPHRLPWAEASYSVQRLGLFSSELLLANEEEKHFTYGQDTGKTILSPQKQVSGRYPHKSRGLPPLPLCLPFPLLSLVFPHGPGFFPTGLSGITLCQPDFCTYLAVFYLTLTPILHLFCLSGSFSWITDCYKGQTCNSLVSPRIQNSVYSRCSINASWMDDWKVVLPHKMQF